MSQRSIRKSLLIRCGIGVGVLLCLLSTGIYLTVRHGLYKELDKSIEQTAALLSDQVELENESVIYEWQEGMGTNASAIDSGLFQFWDETTGLTTRSPGLQSLDLPKFCGENGAPLIKDIQLPDHGKHARAIGLRIYPLVLPAELRKMRERGRIVETQSIPHILVVARDAKPVHRVLARMRWILGIGTLLTLGVVFLLIHRAIEVSLDSIDMLTRQVAHRKGHHLDTPLDLPASLPSELTELANNFNQLLSRVAKTRQRESDFILHAAHELRTPIAGLLTTTDLALSQPRENTEYREHLELCRQSAVDLGTLVKRLSALAQSESSDQEIKPTPVDLAEITRESLKRVSTSFDQRGLRIEESGLSSPHVVTADPALLGIILNNLLDNAACYAPANSAIDIRCTETPETIELSLSNDAPVLPDDLDRLFEPLFRQNQARNDSSSHLGIGLTLSRNAAEAMGALLTARRGGPNRIEFSLTLPKSA